MNQNGGASTVTDAEVGLGVGGEGIEDPTLSALGLEDDSSGGDQIDPAGAGDETLVDDVQGGIDQGSDPSGEDEEDGGGKPAKRDRVQERIDKLTAARHKLEEEVQTLREQLAKVTGGEQVGVAGMDPVDGDPQIRDLSSKVDRAKGEADAARKLRRQLSRFVDDPEKAEPMLAALRAKGFAGSDVAEAQDWLEDYELDQRELYAEARGKVEEVRARRRAEVQAEQSQWNGLAKQAFDWLGDDEDPRVGWVRDAVKRYPWVRQIPQGMAAVAALADLLARQQQAKSGRGSPASQRQQQPTVRPSGGSAAAAGSRGPGGSRDPRQLKRAAAEQRLDQNPDDDAALEALLESMP